MTGERSGYRGYVTSRGFGGYIIPVPVQSLVLRDYCARKKLLYVLPVNENMFAHSYMVLDGLIESLETYEGVLMCSMHMLPQRPERRQRVVDRILEQGCTLHLVLEDLIISGAKDFERMEEFLLLSRLVVKEPSPAILE
jgi:sporadic carbohydrate cluster protein (TIGR04323 family)